jgi:hypothetical protein
MSQLHTPMGENAADGAGTPSVGAAGSAPRLGVTTPLVRRRWPAWFKWLAVGLAFSVVLVGAARNTNAVPVFVLAPYWFALTVVLANRHAGVRFGGRWVLLLLWGTTAPAWGFGWLLLSVDLPVWAMVMVPSLVTGLLVRWATRSWRALMWCVLAGGVTWWAGKEPSGVFLAMLLAKPVLWNWVVSMGLWRWAAAARRRALAIQATGPGATIAAGA